MPDETNNSSVSAPLPAEPAADVSDPAAPAVLPDGPDESEPRSSLPYPVVGIGASAGGIEAFVELFSALPPNTGMAFVVVSHLSPEHKSHLAEMLGRAAAMPVEEIRDGAVPGQNRVYVLPPGSFVRIENGVLRLENRPADVPPGPVDYFFRSLGSDQKTRALGVVLSGTDADGALGLKAIKGEGGIAMVQTPDSPLFPDMPRSSIAADQVDRVLPPGQLAIELAALAAQYFDPVVANTLENGTSAAQEEQHFSRILNLMRGVSGIDFRQYKPNTIRRRIARRMMLSRFHTFAEYAAFLQANSRELRELQEDALINATGFFRDPAQFETLKTDIFPRIFEDRSFDQQVRIWIHGCSTGEEAYSIAICLLDYLAGRPFAPPVQIFGTDASAENIHRARRGMYTESIVAEVSPERLHRYFVKIDKGYQVSKRVRDLCIFARQNLSNDPPFSKMDLISCRNVLIYVGTDLQRQILTGFHYALRPQGHLLLGSTETIRDFTDLFQVVDRRHKFFVKIGVSGAVKAFAVPEQVVRRPVTLPAQPFPETSGDVDLQRAADRIVLARYGPPGVVVNERMEILQSRGHTSPYLEMPQGAATLYLPRMLRDSIAAPVNEAVRQSIDRDVPIRIEAIRVHADGGDHEFSLEVLPIHTVVPRARSFLVLFAPAPGRKSGERDAETADSPTADRDRSVQLLKQDLAATKLYFQTLLDEREARNQELVSAHEEIQSANEELRSTNEELQSSNEELQTVNDELQQRNAILTQATNDLSNLLNSVSLPVLTLDNEQHIRHFTPPTQRLLNLRPSDVGRPFSEIRLNLRADDLQPLFSEVLDTLTPRELEVQDRDGHWHLLRVRPYRTTDNKIEGVVIVILDIDRFRRSEQELRNARNFSRSVVENVPLPLVVVDLELRIRAANDAFRALAGVPADQFERLPDLAALAWGLDEPLRSRLQELRSPVHVNGHFEFEFSVPGEKPRVLNVRGRALKPESEVFLLVTIEDITAETEVARLLAEERESLALEVENATRKLGRTQEDLRALAGSLFASHEDEGRRLARELHDDICQKLAVLEIGAQQALQRIAAAPEEAFADIERIRAGIAALADDVRAMSHRLHPTVIEDLGLVPALRALVQDFQEREGMIATFSAQKVPDAIAPEIATGLYRIAQEALRNVAKHAGKTHVKVAVRGINGALRLQVIDAGEGFDVQKRPSGLGLISMQERARLMQGTFRIESELGEGTRITVDVPLPSATE